MIIVILKEELATVWLEKNTIFLQESIICIHNWMVLYLLLGIRNIFRSFDQFLPNARFSYDFSTTKRLNINYETNFREPSISQLQPVLNNSDPQNLSLGNPSLKRTNMCID